MSEVVIIAEAGVNHNGDSVLARQMIDAAKKAGSDFIKFQTFRTENLVCADAGKAEYQKLTTGNDESQFNMLKRLELSASAHLELFSYCSDVGLQFLSTAFDLDSIDFLHQLGICLWKIPSGEITNIPYLRRIGSFQQQVILSSGMATLGEIETALDILVQSGTRQDDVTVLHCTTEYPTPWTEVNLQAMVTIREAFHVSVGYSDHTPGIEVAIAAVALGASVIEKHFTLDKGLPGPDHKASLEPHELEAMIRAVRHIELALGNGKKAPTPSEKANMQVARKSIVASKHIKKGEIFSEDSFSLKRPGTGLAPLFLPYIVGRRATRDYLPDQFIEL